jgi:hypothetical protein
MEDFNDMESNVAGFDGRGNREDSGNLEHELPVRVTI